ncbi:hypothetical protein KKC59_02955 [bacterium]|nr:hypothetical protein [bacterium]
MKSKLLILMTSLIMLTGCALWEKLDELPEDNDGSTILYNGNGDKIKVKQNKGVFYERNLGL